jgi:hypothetical protein
VRNTNFMCDARILGVHISKLDAAFPKCPGKWTHHFDIVRHLLWNKNKLQSSQTLKSVQHYDRVPSFDYLLVIAPYLSLQVLSVYGCYEGLFDVNLI